MDRRLVEFCNAQHWGLSAHDSIAGVYIDSKRLAASRSLEAGEETSSQLLGQGDGGPGSRKRWCYPLFAVSVGWRPVELAVCVWGGEWRPHTFLTPTLSQSPALKTQGKLNTRPGKVGTWGQMEAGRGRAGAGPEGTCYAFSGDPLLGAWLPGQRQGGLGRHRRCLSVGPCCLHKGDTRLVSGERPGKGALPGCEPGVRKEASPSGVPSAIRVSGHKLLPRDPGVSGSTAGCYTNSQSSGAGSCCCLRGTWNSEPWRLRGLCKASAP